MAGVRRRRTARVVAVPPREEFMGARGLRAPGRAARVRPHWCRRSRSTAVARRRS